MKKNAVITLCVSISVVALGISGLMIGMNIDKNAQDKSMKLITVERKSPENVASKNKGTGQEESNNKDTKEGEDTNDSKNTNDTDSKVTVSKDENHEDAVAVEAVADKTATISDVASAELVECDKDTISYVTCKDGKYKVECTGDVDDENLEVSLVTAVDLGCKYMEEQETNTTKIKKIQLSKSNLSGIRNGSTTWNMSFTANGKKKEVVIDAQTGALISNTMYITDELLTSTLQNDSKEYMYTIENPKLKVFKEIDININSTDVELVTGNHYGINIVYGSNSKPITYSDQNGKLTVRYKEGTTKNKNSKQSSYITVTIPKQVKLDNIKMNINSGDIIINKVSVKNISIVENSGDLEFKNIKYDRCKLDVTSGDIYIKGEVYGVTECTMVSGDVNISCNESQDKYSYNLNSTSGEIQVGNKMKDGSKIKVKQENNKNNCINVNTVSGDITLKFIK